MKKLLMFMGVLCLLVACAKDPLSDLTDEDSQVFITNYDDTVSFSSYKTFATSSDSIIVLQNNRFYLSALSPELNFVQNVTNKFKERGYTRVEKTASPDLMVNIIRVSNSSVGITQNPNYGGYGYGGYYPSSYSFYEITENYWYVEVLDKKNYVANGNKYNVIWNAEIRGNGIFDDGSLNNLVNAVFKQSSYLNR
jgi:Domain of unknown function (DUF4136)